MSRPRKEIPSYRRHKKSGQAIVTFTNQAGGRRDYLLGPYGTKKSKDEYRRLLKEWETLGGQLPPKPGEDKAHADLTVNELLVLFWKWAQSRYVKNGKPTRELDAIKMIMRPLKEFYGNTLACDFGPLALKVVRQSMIDHKITRRVKGEEKVLAHGLARKNINKLVGRIKSLFKWAVANELVPPAAHQALACVAGLRRGEAGRETKPISPVPEAIIESTLPHLPEMVQDMVKVQRLTGCRPGELLTMTALEIDVTAPVWEYRPGSHKTEHHERDRIIFLGPQAQAILKKYLALDLAAPLFSPARSEEARNLQKRATRTTPLTPTAKARRQRQNPRGRAGENYDVAVYRRAVKRACEKAGLPPWNPHQLRHTAATEVRKQFGLEAAQAILGHAALGVTQVYAEKDMDTARRIMAKIG